ncbi:MAG TPA: glycosyltransferase family 4 protein [Vicinamibacterales bacterium]|nr:glycosyltransferase family 4 protein [Vicinamibacterales bacterium]
MRLAYLSVSAQLGGSEIVLLQLLSEIRRQRPAWETHLVAPADGPLTRRAAAAGSTVHVVPMPAAVARLGEHRRGSVVGAAARTALAVRSLWGYERRLGHALGAIRPDVVHSNGLKAHVLSARTAVAARRVWHVHDYVSPRPLTRRLLRRYATTCDSCVAASVSVGEDASRALTGALRSPVQVIPNGIDVERFTPEGPCADLDRLAGLPPVAPGTLRVGLVGTFARWKGHEIFLRALAQVPATVALRGYIVGAPLYDTAGSQFSLQELRAIAREDGCGGRVAFTGFVEDVPAVMRALDVVVHASTSPEPFGLVVAEAMACGRPVISTALGGAAEVLEPGDTALVYHAPDPAALAAAIEELSADAGLRCRLGTRGRSVAVAKHGAERYGRAFIDLYERLADATAP